MDLVRFGLIIRALRRRKGWRQADLAAHAGVSQNAVSLIERGHADSFSLAILLRVAGELDARLAIEIRWRGGELERLLDQDHAALGAAIARLLRDVGWDIEVEVTYAVYGQNGSIDVLAWHGPTQQLLVIEIKTEITSGEATVRKLDEKVRLAPRIALERFGWKAAGISRLLVVEDTTTTRRRVSSGGGLFDAAFPVRTTAIHRWLRAPAPGCSGLLFLPNTNPQVGMSRRGGRHRVRRPETARPAPELNVGAARGSAGHAAEEPTVLTNRTLQPPDL